MPATTGAADLEERFATFAEASLSRSTPQLFGGVVIGEEGVELFVTDRDEAETALRELEASFEAAEGVPAPHVDLRPVTHSYGELVELQGRILRDADWLRDRGVTLSSWGPDIEANRLRIAVADSTPSVRALLEARYGDAPITVVEEQGAWLSYADEPPRR